MIIGGDGVQDGVVSYDVVWEYCIGSCTSKGGDGIDIIQENVLSCESKDCTCDNVACDIRWCSIIM